MVPPDSLALAVKVTVPVVTVLLLLGAVIETVGVDTLA